MFETTGDGIGDYVVGINNDAPRPGDFRVWLTDVATGNTEQQIGPPYGFPVEFGHPDERQPQDPAGTAVVGFTFLGNAPPGLVGGSPFYAWAAAGAGNDVVAWDDAPDASWLVVQAPGG